MLGTNLRCLDNLNGIWGFDTSNSLQTTSLLAFAPFARTAIQLCYSHQFADAAF